MTTRAAAALGERAVLRAGSWLAVPYRPRAVRSGLVIAVLIAVVAVTALPMGSYEIAAHRVWLSLLQPQGAAPHEQLIVWHFRVPRILLGMLVGGMLGAAGALMQAVTRNGLADPGLVGVTEGATVVMLAFIIAYPGFDIAWRPPLAMGGGILVAALVLLLTRRVEGVGFVLIGIGVSAFLGAGISMFVTYGRITQVQTALVWMAGSLAPASWQYVELVAPWAAIGFLIAFLSARATDAMLLGDDVAIGLGVRTQGLRLLLMAGAVGLTAASVATVGALGFVGLIAPHLARFLVGTSQAAVVGGSIVCGGALVLVADSIGRLAFAPVQIPAGIVLALVGVPFFLLLLWRRRHAL